MRRLSMSAARRCELARTAKCKCRCGGLLHGKMRAEDPAFFAALPKDDPHHALPVREKKREKLLPLFEGIA